VCDVRGIKRKEESYVREWKGGWNSRYVWKGKALQEMFWYSRYKGRGNERISTKGMEWYRDTI
jgi:hypothetical protein